MVVRWKCPPLGGARSKRPKLRRAVIMEPAVLKAHVGSLEQELELKDETLRAQADELDALAALSVREAEGGGDGLVAEPEREPPGVPSE